MKSVSWLPDTARHRPVRSEMSKVTLRTTFSSEFALTTESNLVFVPLTYFCDMMAFASVCERKCEKKNNPHDHLTHPTRRLSSRITCVATCEAKKKKRKKERRKHVDS